jgi:hypothetical protein
VPEVRSVAGCKRANVDVAVTMRDCEVTGPSGARSLWAKCRVVSNRCLGEAWLKAFGGSRDVRGSGSNEGGMGINGAMTG